VPVRKLYSIAVVTALCVIAASCSSSSPASPSHLDRAQGATIVGHLNGFSSTTNTQRHLDGTSSVGSTPGLTFTENASTTLTVSINGTNITSNVDGNGNFQLTGVPPGDVTLKFSGAGVNASITLTNVPASAQINITVTLNGNSAKLEDREDENDDNDEDKNEGDLEGVISNKTNNACPNLTFTVQNTTVKTNSSTKFEDGQCAQIANGTKVEVEGTRQADNSVLAKEVEIK
jgi:uncharacterized protein DUF5666